MSVRRFWNRSQVTLARPAIRRNMLKTAAALIAIFAMQSTVSPIVAADTVQPTMVAEGYVHYSADNIPDPAGTLTDIGAVVSVAGDDHKLDSYGNVLIINSTAGTITDVNGQVVGFLAGPG